MVKTVRVFLWKKDNLIPICIELNRLTLHSLLLMAILICSSCYRRQINYAEGWDYNEANGGFQKVPYLEQETSPGTVLIEGGKAEFLSADGKMKTHELVSFYIGITEEPNIYYLNYLSYLKRYYSKATYLAALPDTTVWQQEPINDSIKNYLVSNYLRLERFHYFPVVGLDTAQINRYLEWKTDRLNEYILIREGIFEKSNDAVDSSDVFSTTAYLNDSFDDHEIMQLPDLNPSRGSGKRGLGVRSVRMEDGILLPGYRLPTLAEWKWAAFEIGDSNHTYIKSKQKMVSFDKINDYFLLNPLESKRKRSKHAQVLSLDDDKGLIVVDYGAHKIYQTKHMNDNVPEMVWSGKVVDMSWKDTTTQSLSAKYDGNKPGDFKYNIEDIIQVVSKRKGAVGFRVAVDRVGAPDANSIRPKRRKAKT